MIIMTIVLVVGLLNTGCTSFVRHRLSLTPQVETIEVEGVIPLEAALVITEEESARLFNSPQYPENKLDYPTYFLEPFQIYLGKAFETAAMDVFAQVFKKVTLVRNIDQAGNYPVVVEPKLWDFKLHLIYYKTGTRGIGSEQVEGKCQAQINTNVFVKGKPVWQKKIKTPIESGFWVTTPWLDDRVGELAAETLVLGLSDLAVQLAKDNPLK
jgi:hypothetical protein